MGNDVCAIFAQVNALFDELKTQINEIQGELTKLRNDTKLAPDARADKLAALNEKCNAAKKVRFDHASELLALGRLKCRPFTFTVAWRRPTGA